jgi:hypothetical protein
MTLTLAMIVVLFLSLMGCTGGIPQEQYDSVLAQFEESQAKVADLQGELRALEEQNKGDVAEIEAALKAAQEEMSRLKGEVIGLKEQYELVGETPAETATNIVKYYHETHTYSTADFYVCSDMAADVWNMLKTHGIDAVMQIGSVEAGIGDIAQCNHAWVLAEVSPGEYLALETTSGRIIPQSENPFYYKGWSFQVPKDFKRYQELRREYNIRVDIINQMVSMNDESIKVYEEETQRYKDMIDEFNSKYAGKPVSTESKVLEARIEAQLAMVEEKEERINQINEMIRGQKENAEDAIAEMNTLAIQR